MLRLICPPNKGRVLAVVFATLLLVGVPSANADPPPFLPIQPVNCFTSPYRTEVDYRFTVGASTGRWDLPANANSGNICPTTRFVSVSPADGATVSAAVVPELRVMGASMTAKDVADLVRGVSLRLNAGGKTVGYTVSTVKPSKLYTRTGDSLDGRTRVVLRPSQELTQGWYRLAVALPKGYALLEGTSVGSSSGAFRFGVGVAPRVRKIEFCEKKAGEHLLRVTFSQPMADIRNPTLAVSLLQHGVNRCAKVIQRGMGRSERILLSCLGLDNALPSTLRVGGLPGATMSEERTLPASVGFRKAEGDCRVYIPPV